MSDRIQKIKNITGAPIPPHKLTDPHPELNELRGEGAIIYDTCAKCNIPKWNGIEFRFGTDEIKIVKEDVANHLLIQSKGKLQLEGGPITFEQAILTPDALLAKRPDGSFNNVTLAINTPTPKADGFGETLADVQKKDRFLAKAGG